MRSSPLQLTLSALLIGATLTQNSAAQQKPGVLSGGEGWSWKGQEVTRSTALDSDADLIARGTGDLVLSCGAKGTFSYSCHKQPCRIKACAAPEDLSVSRVELSLAGIAGEFWSALFHREPKEAVIVGARAGGNPSEAVILQDDKGVHFGPALNRILEGRYCFRLTELPARPAGPVFTFTLEWDRSVDAEGAVSVPKLSPGLYSLQKGSPDAAGGGCRLDDDGVPAWVLVAASADFQRVRAAWEQRVPAIADFEQSGASPQAVATVRHGLMAWLAEPGR